MAVAAVVLVAAAEFQGCHLDWLEGRLPSSAWWCDGRWRPAHWLSQWLSDDARTVMRTSASGVLVRAATPADAGAMSEIKRRAIYISAVGYYTPEQLQAWAAPVSSDGMASAIRRTRAFVGVVEGKVVGFANLIESSSELDQLYVDPDYGGRGVARALVTVIEAEASNLGLTELRTRASWRAEPVFARLGFTRVNVEEHDFNGQSFATVHMQKTRTSRRST